MGLLLGGATDHDDQRPADRGEHPRSGPAEPTRSFVDDVARGDERAWATLINRYSGLLYATARRYSLTNSEVEDVVQHTWLKLLEHAATIRDPACLPGWLATTTRRECLARRQSRWRESPMMEWAADPPDQGPDPLRVVLDREASASLWAAIECLPRRERDLLRMMLETPAPSYLEISERLGIPVGSIGPVRGRALRRLRTLLSGPGAARCAPRRIA
jgi:RNA polymerase sigma factor (sigma-70 family)